MLAAPRPLTYSMLEHNRVTTPLHLGSWAQQAGRRPAPPASPVIHGLWSWGRGFQPMRRARLLVITGREVGEQRRGAEAGAEVVDNESQGARQTSQPPVERAGCTHQVLGAEQRGPRFWQE